MTTYTVILPDGTKETRTTKRNYTHVCAFRITQNNIVNPWGAQWSSTENGAKKMAAAWNTCKSAKNGWITVETEVIKL